MHIQKKIFAMLMLVALNSGVQCNGNYDSMPRPFTQAKNIFEAIAFRIAYNKNYLMGGAAVAGGCMFAPRSTLATATVVTLYLAAQARYTLWRIGRKYYQAEREDREWAFGSSTESSMLSRWRQNNQFGDGCFWQSAYWMLNDIENVKAMFMIDIRSQRIVVKDAQGKTINNPQPWEVINAIKSEMASILEDMKTVGAYTDIYKVYAQPEEFKPDRGYTVLLWPNYNMASALFVQLDQLVKRLDVLRDVVSCIQSQVRTAYI
jgi:hypothetical protein